MADVDINDLLEITVKGFFGTADDVINVFQVKITDPLTGTADESLGWAAEWVLGIYSTISAQLSSQYAYDEITVDNLTQGTFLGQDFAGFIGANASEPLPPQICALVMGRTAEAPVDGRKYFGVFGEDMQDGGAWNAATKANLALAGAFWKDPLTGAIGVTGQGQVVTKLPPAAPVGRDIVAIKVIRDCRTQRRRTLGRGS